jgi:hypothetical protein
MMNYLDNYQGIAQSGTIPLAAGETKRLPPNECRFVQLYQWNTADDETFDLITTGVDAAETDDEVYYGFDGVIAGQLFPSRATELLPINNTSQITLRRPNKGNGVVVRYTYFK